MLARRLKKTKLRGYGQGGRGAPLSWQLAGTDARVERWIKPYIGLLRRIVKIDRVRRCLWIKALADEIGFLVLERSGDVDPVLETQEERQRIRRQPLRQTLAQVRQTQIAVADQHRHSGGAFGSGNGNAVNRRLDDAGTGHDCVGDFGGRDVLAFPAKRIADTVDEIMEAARVHPHQIAGAIPGVAWLEHVAQDLALGVFGAGIALEVAAALRCAANSAERFARFAGDAAQAASMAVAHRRTRHIVEFDQHQRKAMLEKWRHAADSAGFALDIVERDVAFGRRIEFQNPGNPKPRLEALPYVGAQSVAG